MYIVRFYSKSFTLVLVALSLVIGTLFTRGLIFQRSLATDKRKGKDRWIVGMYCSVQTPARGLSVSSFFFLFFFTFFFCLVATVFFLLWLYVLYTLAQFGEVERENIRKSETFCTCSPLYSHLSPHLRILYCSLNFYSLKVRVYVRADTKQVEDKKKCNKKLISFGVCRPHQFLDNLPIIRDSLIAINIENFIIMITVFSFILIILNNENIISNNN